MNPIKKLASQTAIYGIGYMVGRLLNFLLLPFHTRIFVNDEYGDISVLYVWAAFALVAFTFGMETSYFRFATKNKDSENSLSTAFWSVVAISILITAIVCLSAKSLAVPLGVPDHYDFIIYFALIVCFDAIASIPFAILRFKNKAEKYASIKLLNVIITIGFNLFFLAPIFSEGNASFSNINSVFNYKYDPAFGIGYVFLANLIASAMTLLMLLPFILKIKFIVDLNLLGKMVKYGIPIAITSTAILVNENYDKIALDYFLSGDADFTRGQIGIYNACYKLSIFMTIAIQAFKYAAEPFFFSHSEEKNAKTTYSRIMTYFIIVCLTIFLFVSFYLDIFILILGKTFREGQAIVPILLIANLFLGIFYNLSVWYKLNDKTRYGAVLAIGGAIITIVMNIILIPIFGYYGSAWTTLICYAAMMTASYLWGRKHYAVPYNLRKIGVYILLALVLFSIGYFGFSDLDIIKYFLNACLILIFLGVAYFIEKPGKVLT